VPTRVRGERLAKAIRLSLDPNEVLLAMAQAYVMSGHLQGETSRAAPTHTVTGEGKVVYGGLRRE
jgi:hypothetical protein